MSGDKTLIYCITFSYLHFTKQYFVNNKCISNGRYFNRLAFRSKCIEAIHANLFQSENSKTKILTNFYKENRNHLMTQTKPIYHVYIKHTRKLLTL